ELLGLGTLAALDEAIPLVREHEGVTLDLAHLPPDDPDVYAMLRAADTVGVFQIESRAQMATLPRMKPDHFYDLVVEVAIIRPGPIVGKMVNPYLARRTGRQVVTYPHPSLEPILKRIKSFALYGFPESHAASFALLAYASAYLKRHHPAAFTCALLNNWPMGFYHPTTLVNDAARHGVDVRPVDVARSGWLCDLE